MTDDEKLERLLEEAQHFKDDSLTWARPLTEDEIRLLAENPDAVIIHAIINELLHDLNPE